MTSCEKCNLVSYCSVECLECDQDNHYEFCLPSGIISTQEGLVAKTKVETGDLLWRERAVCRQSSLENFFKRIRLALPRTPFSVLNTARPIIDDQALFFFLLASSCTVDNPNTFCSIEKLGKDFILSVYASRVIVPETYISLPSASLSR